MVKGVKELWEQVTKGSESNQLSIAQKGVPLIDLLLNIITAAEEVISSVTFTNSEELEKLYFETFPLLQKLHTSDTPYYTKDEILSILNEEDENERKGNASVIVLEAIKDAESLEKFLTHLTALQKEAKKLLDEQQEKHSETNQYLKIIFDNARAFTAKENIDSNIIKIKKFLFDEVIHLEPANVEFDQLNLYIAKLLSASEFVEHDKKIISELIKNGVKNNNEDIFFSITAYYENQSLIDSVNKILRQYAKVNITSEQYFLFREVLTQATEESDPAKLKKLIANALDEKIKGIDEEAAKREIGKKQLIETKEKLVKEREELRRNKINLLKKLKNNKREKITLKAQIDGVDQTLKIVESQAELASFELERFIKEGTIIGKEQESKKKEHQKLKKQLESLEDQHVIEIKKICRKDETVNKFRRLFLEEFSENNFQPSANDIPFITSILNFIFDTSGEFQYIHLPKQNRNLPQEIYNNLKKVIEGFFEKIYPIIEQDITTEDSAKNLKILIEKQQQIKKALAAFGELEAFLDWFDIKKPNKLEDLRKQLKSTNECVKTRIHDIAQTIKNNNQSVKKDKDFEIINKISKKHFDQELAPIEPKEEYGVKKFNFGAHSAEKYTNDSQEGLVITTENFIERLNAIQEFSLFAINKLKKPDHEAISKLKANIEKQRILFESKIFFECKIDFSIIDQEDFNEDRAQKVSHAKDLIRQFTSNVVACIQKVDPDFSAKQLKAAEIDFVTQKQTEKLIYIQSIKIDDASAIRKQDQFYTTADPIDPSAVPSINRKGRLVNFRVCNFGVISNSGVLEENFEITRSGSPLPIGIKDKNLRKIKTKEHLLELIEKIVILQIRSRKIKINKNNEIQNVNIFIQGLIADFIGSKLLQKRNSETLQLQEISEAIKELNHKPTLITTEYNGDSIKLNIKPNIIFANQPANPAKDITSPPWRGNLNKQIRNSGTNQLLKVILSTFNEQFKSISGSNDPAKISMYVALRIANNLLQPFVEIFSEPPKEDDYKKHAELRNKCIKIFGEHESQLNKNYKQILEFLERRPLPPLTVTEQSLMQNTLLLFDFLKVYLTKEESNKNENIFEQQARLLILAKTSGFHSHFFCKSGKDRTGQLFNVLIEYLVYKRLYGHYPTKTVDEKHLKIREIVARKIHDASVSKGIAQQNVIGNAGLQQKGKLGVTGGAIDSYTSGVEKDWAKIFTQGYKLPPADLSALQNFEENHINFSINKLSETRKAESQNQSEIKPDHHLIEYEEILKEIKELIGDDNDEVGFDINTIQSIVEQVKNEIVADEKLELSKENEESITRLVRKLEIESRNLASEMKQADIKSKRKLTTTQVHLAKEMFDNYETKKQRIQEIFTEIEGISDEYLIPEELNKKIKDLYHRIQTQLQEEYLWVKKTMSKDPAMAGYVHDQVNDLNAPPKKEINKRSSHKVSSFFTNVDDGKKSKFNLFFNLKNKKAKRVIQEAGGLWEKIKNRNKISNEDNQEKLAILQPTPDIKENSKPGAVFQQAETSTSSDSTNKDKNIVQQPVSGEVEYMQKFFDPRNIDETEINKDKILFNTFEKNSTYKKENGQFTIYKPKKESESKDEKMTHLIQVYAHYYLQNPPTKEGCERVLVNSANEKTRDYTILILYSLGYEVCVESEENIFKPNEEQEKQIQGYRELIKDEILKYSEREKIYEEIFETGSKPKAKLEA